MNKKSVKGHLLIAAGTLVDHNFYQTVILLCEHQHEGSYGLILNRPIDDIEELVCKMPFTKNRLFQGGPVQTEVMQFLHPYGNKISGAMEIIPGIWIGGDFDQLQKGFESGELNPKDCRFYLGYSGWGQQQLDNEFDNGFWLSIPSNKKMVFQCNPEKLWAEAVRQLSNKNPLYRFLPDDPNLN